MYLVALSPLVDCINGFFLLNGHDVNISSIYKSGLMALCLLLLIKMRYVQKKRLIHLFVFICLVVNSCMIASLADSSGFLANINVSVKMLMPIVFFVYLIEALRVYDSYFRLTKVIEWMTWFYPISILIPTLLGTGFYTYTQNEFGYKGFYYAGNELGAIMIVLLVLSMQRYFDNRRRRDLACLLMNLIIDVFIGVKSIYIALTIFLVVYFCNNIKMKKAGALLGVCVLLFGIGVLIVSSGNGFINEMIELQKWRFETYASRQGNNIWMNFLLSGRNVKIDDSLSVLIQSRGLLGVLFGAGTQYMISTIGSIVEMDFIDLFLWNGAIVLFAFVGGLFSFFSKNWKKFFVYEKVMILEIIGFAALAGHVIYAPSVGIVFSLAIAAALCRYDLKRVWPTKKTVKNSKRGG